MLEKGEPICNKISLKRSLLKFCPGPLKVFWRQIPKAQGDMGHKGIGMARVSRELEGRMAL